MWIANQLMKVGFFFSLPLFAAFGFFTFNFMRVWEKNDEPYWSTLNEMMNFIYDEWADTLKEMS